MNRRFLSAFILAAFFSHSYISTFESLGESPNMIMIFKFNGGKKSTRCGNRVNWKLYFKLLVVMQNPKTITIYTFSNDT